MNIFDDKRFSRVIKLQTHISKPVIRRWLKMNGIEVVVERLPEIQTERLSRYSAVVGKGNMMLSSQNKALSRSPVLKTRLGVLTESFYDFHNPVQNDIEVIYEDNLLKVGDTINMRLFDKQLQFVINDIPKTYYDIMWTCILQPLKQEPL